MNIQTKDYQIILEEKMNFKEYLKDFNLNRTFVITDERVFELYHEKIREIDKTPIVVKQGENSKSLLTYEYVTDRLLKAGIKREDTLIAFGGGVVGDLTGFVASTILRGVKYILIPTTLLAMIDSSIGGKTALNSSQGKNLIGTFYSPYLVLIDPSFLITLPTIEYRSGLIEMIKIAAVLDDKFFYRICNKEQVKLKEIVRAIKLKLKIVENDFKDQNDRQLLNFGHTFGHALEIMSDYRIPHGIAVALGMLYEIKLAVDMGLTDIDIYFHFSKIFVEKDIVKIGVKDEEKAELKELILKDKKTSGQEITFIYLEKIGKGKLMKIDVVDFINEY